MKRTTLLLLSGPLWAFAGTLVYASALPDQWRVEREATLGVEPQKILRELRDLSRWPSWAEWGRKDPTIDHETWGDPGEKQRITWEGRGEHNEVRAQLVSIEPDRVEHKLWLGDGPTALGQIEIRAQNGGSRVRWTLGGTFGGRLTPRLFRREIEAAIGDDLSAGLERLGRVATGTSAP